MQLIPCDVCLTQSVAWAFQAVTTKQHRLEICHKAGFCHILGATPTLLWLPGDYMRNRAISRLSGVACRSEMIASD